ncbi:MAG TPA: saposin domain-containing protein [Candidatus Binatia bacterium]|jgi:hypothetical protein|nr:saposin domain-containing protein [Candidatus Binatia bacterium]
MTKLKGAAILGALAIAGVTLLGSFPASGGESFLLINTKRLSKACRAVDDADRSGICKVAAGLVERLGGLDPEIEIPPAQLERALRKMGPFVKRGLKQECCDPPCRRQCSGGGFCFTDDQCTGGETCLPCPEQPCQTSCAELKGNRCDGCIHMVSNLEAWLANNGSAKLLGDVMENACDGRFADPAITQQCKGEVRQSVNEVIDLVLANAPPATACQNPALRACPQ